MTEAEWVLWGFKPSVPVFRAPLALTGGTLRHCRSEQGTRKAEGGWTLGIYRQGDAPVGLRLQAEEVAR